MQGDLRKKRNEIQEELINLENFEETIGLSLSHIERKCWLIFENCKMLEQEELYWHERSHETWLLKGDINTSFFTNV